MSAGLDVRTSEGSVEVELDEDLYPKDAIYGASYVFIDRAYVHLDRAGDRRVRVTIRPKKGSFADSQAVAGEFENELLGQAWRRLIADENRSLIEAITARAIGGAAGPPGLDELLAEDIGAETAFDDPLGIAMSWEERYGKKKAAAAEADTVAGASDTEPAAPPSAVGPDSDEGPARSGAEPASGGDVA